MVDRKSSCSNFVCILSVKKCGWPKRLDNLNRGKYLSAIEANVRIAYSASK